MKKNYVAFAALAGLLSLAACNGKPASEQAAEDAQKVNADSLVPQLAAALAGECSGGGINIACPAEKAKDFVKAAPAVAAIIKEHDKKCPDNYGAKTCAQGYTAYFADNLAARLAGPVADRAKQSLIAKAETLRRAAAEADAKAKAEAAEAAAQAQAEAAEAARKAQEEAAKAAEEAAKPAPAATETPAPAAPAASGQ